MQISETETPLHRLETVYRRVGEALRRPRSRPARSGPCSTRWLFTLESDASAADPAWSGAGEPPWTRRSRRCWSSGCRRSPYGLPAFAQALRGYRPAVTAGDAAAADGLMAWLGGQPHVAAAAKRRAGIRGDLDHFGALGFLQGLLTVLRDPGTPGWCWCSTRSRPCSGSAATSARRRSTRCGSCIDEIDAGRFPGLYLVITGTPAFYDGPQGVPRLAPLAQRLATDFSTDARFDNPRAVQLRLPGFDRDALRGARREGARPVRGRGAPTRTGS